MRNLIVFIFISLLLSFVFVNNSQARIRQYINPYDISQIEWQLLNWTAAWRDTTTPAFPFTLERMEYDRTKRKVIIYLQGKSEFATDENLRKSIDGIASLFNQKFPEFNPKEDMIVYYSLISPEGNKTVPIKYENGSFIKQQDNSQQSLPDIISP
ncbi:MAG: hypothetical protein ABIH18_07820 [Candidatus Omnitrophota bacterium]